MRIALQTPKAEWFKAESSAAASAVTTLLGIWLGWTPEVLGMVVILTTYAAGFVTVKDQP